MIDKILAVDIASRLRRDILRGKLLPGTPLKERDRAADLGVSRTPMREAIRILAKEGLVTLRPARSPLVAAPTMKDIADQVLVMRALEKLSAELACSNAENSDINAIRAVNDRMIAVYDTADDLDLFEIDMSFHIEVAKASHNTPLVETHNAFLTRLWRVRYLAARRRRNRERVLRHHQAILDALAERDVQAVRAAIDTHLVHLSDDIRLALEDERNELEERVLALRRNSSRGSRNSVKRPSAER